MRFQKGQSGNPGGRPKKGWTWSEVFQKAVETKKKGKELKQLIAAKVVEEASNGNMDAVKIITNRMDGMPLQRLAGNDSGPLEIVFKRKNDS